MTLLAELDALVSAALEVSVAEEQRLARAAGRSLHGERASPAWTSTCHSRGAFTSADRGRQERIS